jgi:hypothetical protein
MRTCRYVFDTAETMFPGYLVLFMQHVMLFPMLNVLYFYVLSSPPTPQRYESTL